MTARALPYPARRPLRRRILGDHPSAWWFILPSVVLILGLNFIPIGWSFLLSLKSSDLVSPSKWVGLDNYSKLAHDQAFKSAIEHTLLYTGLFVPLSIAGGLAIALMLNRRMRFMGFYRLCIFVPFIISAVAEGVLFAFVFDPNFGVANTVLHALGIQRQGFLQDPGQALLVLVGIGLWGGAGFCVVVLLAALQDIPRELAEAAAIDGAGRWSTFRNVTLPSLRPVLVFLVVWQTFDALQLFDLVYATTRGGPLNSTVVVVYFVYEQAFQFFTAGYGAAAAYVLAMAMLVVGLLVLGLRRLRARAV